MEGSIMFKQASVVLLSVLAAGILLAPAAVLACPASTQPGVHKALVDDMSTDGANSQADADSNDSDAMSSDDGDGDNGSNDDAISTE